MKNCTKRNLDWLFPLLIILLLSACSDDDEVLSQDEIIITRLQEVIDDKIGNDENKLVGVSVSIRVGTEERWNLVGGLSSLGDPVTSEMKFGVGSVTKTVVAATIMKLVDDGVLSLDDTIGKWLSLELANVDNSITIEQLLSHSTGLNGYMVPDLWTRAETNPDTPISPLELADYILEPVNTPGVTFEYSNSNYLILGLIIEASTNKTVGEVMREKFWVPLNLNSMYFGANETIPEPIASPWRDNNDDGTLTDIKSQYGAAFHSIFFCAADVFSNATDLSMWAQNLYGGNAISQNSRTKLMTSYYDFSHPMYKGYGFGTSLNSYNGRIMWGHTGGMRGYGSLMFYDPESKVSIAILNNQSKSEDGPTLRQELIEELLPIVLESL